jgi:hypothetical protein
MARAFRWWNWDRRQQRQPDPRSKSDQRVRRPLHLAGRMFVADNTSTGGSGGRGDAPLIELWPSGELRPAVVPEGELGGTSVHIR